MSDFQSNVRAIIGLRQNQQQFNQNDTSLRRGGEMDAQRISNDRSKFELDRSRGFMPQELRMAQLQGDAAQQSLYDQKQQSSFNADMNKYDLQGRGMDMADRSALAGRRQVDWAHEDKNRVYDLQGRGMDMADRSALAGRRQVDWAHDDKSRAYDLRSRGMDMADRSALAGRRQVDWAHEDKNRAYDLRSRGMDMADRSALAGRRQVDWAHDDKNRDYDLRSRGMDMEDRIASRYSNSKTYSAPSFGGFGGGFGGLGSSGFSTPAIQSSYSYGGHKPDQKAYANGGAVVSFGDLEQASVAGRMRISGPGMKEYNAKYAFGPGTGRSSAPQDFRNERYSAAQKKPASTRRKLADGGPVQDVQAKGFVPVQVSNGEFEFTPEQVANIGAAMLASKEQVPA